jgi:acyl-CoA synthetase (AMP-forming)/AMP-acid ligase II
MTKPHYDIPDLSLRCATLVELLRARATHQSQQLAFTFLQDGEVEVDRWTYQELDQRSRAIAAQLQALGLQGERALLLYPPGLEYLAAFFGCLYAGAFQILTVSQNRVEKSAMVDHR